MAREVARPIHEHHQYGHYPQHYGHHDVDVHGLGGGLGRGGRLDRVLGQGGAPSGPSSAKSSPRCSAEKRALYLVAPTFFLLVAYILYEAVGALLTYVLHLALAYRSAVVSSAALHPLRWAPDEGSRLPRGSGTLGRARVRSLVNRTAPLITFAPAAISAC